MGLGYGLLRKVPPVFGYPNSLRHTHPGGGGRCYTRSSTYTQHPGPLWIAPGPSSTAHLPRHCPCTSYKAFPLCNLTNSYNKSLQFVVFTTHERNKIMIWWRSSVKSPICALSITEKHSNGGVCLVLRLDLVFVGFAVPQLLFQDKHCLCLIGS